MRVQLTGKNAKNFKPQIIEQGLEIVSENPEVIITYGGDGTLLAAEREFPSIPKLPIRDSLICIKCPKHDEKLLLKKLAEGKLKLQEYKKLETTILYQTLYALNDFVLRNASPIHAIRFQFSQDDIPSKLYIGDGIVLSTSFGSTGYFKSITGESFEDTKQLWGLTCNNTTEKIFPLYPENEDKICFKLIRGKATLSFDNSPDIFNIDEGSELIFKLSDQTAKIYELESLRCPDCKVTRG